MGVTPEAEAREAAERALERGDDPHRALREAAVAYALSGTALERAHKRLAEAGHVREQVLRSDPEYVGGGTVAERAEALARADDDLGLYAVEYARAERAETDACGLLGRAAEAWGARRAPGWGVELREFVAAERLHRAALGEHPLADGKEAKAESMHRIGQARGRRDRAREALARAVVRAAGEEPPAAAPNEGDGEGPLAVPSALRVGDADDRPRDNYPEDRAALYALVRRARDFARSGDDGGDALRRLGEAALEFNAAVPTGGLREEVLLDEAEPAPWA